MLERLLEGTKKNIKDGNYKKKENAERFLKILEQNKVKIENVDSDTFDKKSKIEKDLDDYLDRKEVIDNAKAKEKAREIWKGK